MRIATWNMGYWGHSTKCADAWRWLLDDLRPDVALLQECVVPAWVREKCNVVFEPALQKWGTAVVTQGLAATREHLHDVEEWFLALGPDAYRRCAAARLSRWCVPASVALPDRSSILVISLHNPAYAIDPKLYAHLDVTAIKLKHQRRRVWVQDVVFHFLGQTQTGRPLIIGGDLNTSRLFDIPKPKGNAEFFERVEEHFTSLHKCDERTFFGSGEYQLDYLYADPNLASQTTHCWVVPRKKWLSSATIHHSSQSSTSVPPNTALQPTPRSMVSCASAARLTTLGHDVDTVRGEHLAGRDDSRCGWPPRPPADS